MTGVDSHGCGGVPKDGAAPVKSPFRLEIERRVKVLRSLRNPTVHQIESAIFWEEYLKAPEPTPRPLQAPPDEPAQCL